MCWLWNEGNKMSENFIHAKFEICAVCHKVTKCHVLVQDDDPIFVCGLCDAEWCVKIQNVTLEKMEDQKQLDHQSHETGKYFNYVSNASWKNFQHTE